MIGIIGPRQAGKTTLSRMLGKAHFFDLENHIDLARLDNPDLTIGPLNGLIVLDEIQRRPELFPYLRHLLDREPGKRKFVVLGSASPHLLQQSTESLAGRISYIELDGFRHEMVPLKYRKHFWLRGGLPRSLLARNNTVSLQWRGDYIKTFLERDIPQLGFTVNATTMRRFWNMLANMHGSILNLADLSRSFGMSETAVRNYVDILESTFMLHVLKPWHENISKRQIRRPKIYFRDSGILHSLLGIGDEKDLAVHPRLGFLWEGYVINILMKRLAAPGVEFYFWASHGGAELDLLVKNGRKRTGYEIKYSDAPVLTESMKSSFSSLKLDELQVIYPGKKTYMLADRIKVVPWGP